MLLQLSYLVSIYLITVIMSYSSRGDKPRNALQNSIGTASLPIRLAFPCGIFPQAPDEIGNYSGRLSRALSSVFGGEKVFSPEMVLKRRPS